MIKVTIEFPNEQAAAEALLKLHGSAVSGASVTAPVAVAPAAPAPAAPAQTFAPAPAPAPAAPAPAPAAVAPAAAPAPAPAPAPVAGGGITQAQVVAAAQAFSKQYGPKAAKERLTLLGVDAIGKLTADQYPTALQYFAVQA